MKPKERAPLAQPLTPREEACVELLDQGLSEEQIAAQLGITPRTANAYIAGAGHKIPGDLPRKLRILNWYRGGKHWHLPRRRRPKPSGG